MFTELMPIIRNRSLTIFVMDAGDGKLKVNIVPKQLKEDENTALSLPLAPQMIEGTPEEFDRDLPEALKQFVSNHLTIADVVATSAAEIAEVKKNADAAVTAAKDEAAKKLKKNNVPAMTTSPAPAPAAVPPAPPSLFDSLGSPGSSPKPAAATAATSATETAADAAGEIEDRDESQAAEDEPVPADNAI